MVLTSIAALIIIVQFLLKGLGRDVKAEEKDGKVTFIDNKTGENLGTIKALIESYFFMRFFPRRITTTATVKPSSPDVEFVNPLNQDLVVLNVSLSIAQGNAFQTKGKIAITVNDVAILEDTPNGLFTDIESLNIPIPAEGLILKKGEKVKAFVWTTDGTSSIVTVGFLVGAK